MDYVSYEVKLKSPLAGLPTTAIPAGGYGWFQTKGFFTPDNSEMPFYNIMDGFAQLFLGPYLANGKHLISHINNAIAIICKNQIVHVHINAPLLIRALTKTPVNAGELVPYGNLADINEFRIHNVDIPHDAGVMFYFQVDWRQAFFLDLEPIQPDGEKRKKPFEKELAKYWAILSYPDVFQLTTDDYKKLSELAWFPFIALNKRVFKELVSCIKNSFDPKPAIDKLIASIDESTLTLIEKRFENSAFLKTEVDFLKDAISCYKSKKYRLCISALVPRIEGAIRKLFAGRDDKITSRNMVRVLVEYVRTKHPYSTLFLPNEFGAYLADFYFRNFNIDPNDKDDSISRHTHAHGVSDGEAYTQEKALIYLLIFDQIAYYTM